MNASGSWNTIGGGGPLQLCEGTRTGGKGPSQQTQDTQSQLTSEQIALANQQNQRSQTLFNTTEPGLGIAENFYTSLASGDKGAIQRSTAPATEQIASNYNQAIQNLSENMPRGGAKDLAVQEANISKAGAIGSTESQAYLGAFPALASLAGQGVGLSINEVTQALAGFQGASSSNQALGQMQGAGKAETLGFLGSLGQSAATGAGLAVGCWIAAAIFGDNSLHTIRLRVYLNQVWAKQSRIGRVVMWAYVKFGERVARQVEKRNWLRRLFAPLFQYADRCAYRWELSKVDFVREASYV